MCGIIYYNRLDGKSPSKSVLKRYDRQKMRGQDGFGFVALKDGIINQYERSEKDTEIIPLIEQSTGNELFFHHRMPTSTENVVEAAHPIKVSNDYLKHDYYVIHNGMIWDDAAWKTMHEELGFKYVTELKYKLEVNGRLISERTKWNDSEALAIELALDLDKDQKGISVDGSIAFMALQTDKEGKAINLFWGRNAESPLMFQELKDQFISVASEGHGDSVPVNTLYTFNHATKAITSKGYRVGLWNWDETKSAAINEYRDYGRKKKANARAEEDDVPNFEAEYWDHYQELLDQREELEHELQTAVQTGGDTDELERELDLTEAELVEMERPIPYHNG